MDEAKAKLIAEAMGTQEGRKMLWDAMMGGVEIFVRDYFSKWDGARQKRWIWRLERVVNN